MRHLAYRGIGHQLMADGEFVIGQQRDEAGRRHAFGPAEQQRDRVARTLKVALAQGRSAWLINSPCSPASRIT
jgi:hypothetical protein